jgi:hypothetical protein
MTDINRVVNRGLVAKASTIIDASIAKVWEALTSPEKIKQYMFGTDVVSDWKEGSSIRWKGEWQGKKYEDKGVILKLKSASWANFICSVVRKEEDRCLENGSNYRAF